MKFSIILFFVCISVTVQAQKLERKLIGKWEMSLVIMDGTDVTEEHNPKNNRFFIFEENGTFESGGDPYGKNTGRVFVNNLNRTIYIDSDQGADDDSMWIVSFDKDEMIWSGTNTDWNGRFEVRHKKVSK